MLQKILLLAGGGVTGILIGFWDNIFGSKKNKEKVNKKRIAVLGNRNVGKTSFYYFLKNGEVKNQDYSQTKSKTKIMESIIDVGDGNSIRLAVNYDVSGSVNAYGDWRDQIEKSDAIFYIVDINNVLNNDPKVKENIKKDLAEIAELVRKKENIPILIIANKSDKNNLYKTDYNKFETLVNEHPLILEIMLEFGGSSKVKIIIGSLKTNEEAKSLVRQCFQSF